MKVLNKISIIVLPIVIWLIIVLYMLLNKFIGNFTENFEVDNVWLLFIVMLIFNTAIQIFIISACTVIAVKKLRLNIKKVFLSLPIMYLLFGLYSPPSMYLFVFTDEWSILSNYHPAMPSWIASIFITLQYGVVMLITTLIVSRKNDGGNRT